jgi:flagellar basal-body rod modification protein FlgD
MSSSAINNTAAAGAGSQNLTEADFLQLLVTQMSSQDPLNPQSDTAFAAQLAQFSSLKESQTMQENMATLQANSLIGETVSVNPPGAQPLTGVVSGVQMSGGTPYIVVNGQPYDLSTVTTFSSLATQTAPTQAAVAHITPKTH